jgi:hypothetical protein
MMERAKKPSQQYMFAGSQHTLLAPSVQHSSQSMENRPKQKIVLETVVW